MKTNYKGYIINVEQDEYSDSPREWSNVGIIAYKHSRYLLGEETINDPIEWLIDKLNLSELSVQRIWTKYATEREVFNYLEKRFFREYAALPVYLYDHSGITINTCGFSCPWDSGKIGYIYATKESCKEIGVENFSKRKIKNILEQEIETFDQYITGDVYRYAIQDKDGVIIDSCCGIYGEDEAINDAKVVIDYIS